MLTILALNLAKRSVYRWYSMANLKIEMGAEDQKPRVSTNGSSQIVTPWEVTGEKDSDGGIRINYSKLINDFGCSQIDEDLIKRFERITGKPAHRLIRRGIFFAHRDLDYILNLYEKNKKIYIYTGRGPSSENIHIGHIIPFFLCKYLQEVFDATLIVQFTNDEKYLFGKGFSIQDTLKWTEMNAKDLISLGLNPKKTYFLSNLTSMNPSLYRNVVLISKMVTLSQSKSTFGLNDSDSIGKAHFVALESAPAFSSTFPELFPDGSPVPCLIPSAIDQDPFFRIARDYASRSNNLKPGLIYSSFVPSLSGIGKKMSSSDSISSIFINDTPAQVKQKINKYAFSGGRDTLEEHRKYGGNPEVDIPFQYLRYILDDDDQLEDIRVRYKRGELLSSDMKELCINEINKLLSGIQENRKKVTDEDLRIFMTPKPVS